MHGMERASGSVVAVTQRTRPRSHLCHSDNGTARALHAVHQSLLGVRQRVTSRYTSCHAAAPVGGVRSPRNDKSRRLRSELTAAEERRADMMALRKRGF